MAQSDLNFFDPTARLSHENPGSVFERVNKALVLRNVRLRTVLLDECRHLPAAQLSSVLREDMVHRSQILDVLRDDIVLVKQPVRVADESLRRLLAALQPLDGQI